ncbi:hypothetical protein FSP39_005455 [Pinctada imbricata]|uniref:Peroxisomal membrane protein PEX16 n=1 Tax=Pinctada imbricata TaxID=66713 RepID=A0AA89C0U7_PINIB|nr:hypothetical protein FSP39_005455 [Pinctada imbricata]
MSSIKKKADGLIIEAWEKYRKYVSENPETVSQLEATSRVLSYILAGRFEDSQVFSELVYLASNLLVLVNDTIIQQASKLVPKVSLSEQRLKQFLTVLEYGEVFLEIVAGRKWGETGRWILIAIIQLTKAMFRLLLLWKKRAGIQPCPPMAPIDREKFTKQFKVSPAKERREFEESLDGEHIVDGEPENGISKVTFTLKRSGKVIRRLSAAPPINFRSWKIPNENGSPDEDKVKPHFYPPSPLTKRRMYAESLYICRPLIHLIGMYSFGIDSWKPWLLSGGTDIASLCMMGETMDLNPKEKGEIKKRTLMLLYYLLRSPFYDHYTRAKLLFTLTVLAENVPVIGIILRPLVEYLPVWQRIYFYLWSS